MSTRIYLSTLDHWSEWHCAITRRNQWESHPVATDETQALQIIESARRMAESGRELSPDVIHELERIAESDLPTEIRLEAEIILGLEAMA